MLNRPCSFALAMITAMIMGVGFADNVFAEEEDHQTVSIDLPFTLADDWSFETNCVNVYDPQDTDRSFMRCWFFDTPMEEDYQPAVFVPRGEEPTCSELDLVYDPEFNKCVTADELAQSAYENYLEETTLPEPPMSRTDKILEQLDSKTNLSDRDEKLHDLLSKLNSECVQGQGRSAAIQNYDSWDVPVEEYIDPESGETKIRLADDNSINNDKYRGLIGELNMAVEQCIGQQTLESEILSDADKHLAEGNKFSQPYHADIAKSTQPWSQEQVEKHENIGKEVSLRYNPICYSDIYHQNVKALYGCPEVEYISDPTIEIPEMKDYSETSPMEKLQQYQDDPESVVEDLKQQNLQKYKDRTR